MSVSLFASVAVTGWPIVVLGSEFSAIERVVTAPAVNIGATLIASNIFKGISLVLVSR